MHLDVFNDDAFSVVSLTAAINERPHQPGRLGQLGYFDEQGITTTTLSIEMESDSLSLVPARPRGANGDEIGGTKRKMLPINTVHLPQRDAVLADEIQNVRQFGSETETQALQTIVNQRLDKGKRKWETTMEYHRMGAVRGQVLDADGTTVILDLYSSFGVTKQTHSLALATTTTKVRNKVIEAKRKVENALGAYMYTGLRAFCSADFFDAFVAHEDVVAAYDRYQNGQWNRDDLRGGFFFAGVYWEEYRGKVGAIDFVPTGKALLVPEGVPGLFVTRYAPADYNETVNTVGLPLYAKQERMRMDKGVEIEMQSNPICLNTRPATVIELQE